MIQKTVLYIFISVLFSVQVGAQFYNTGQDPASLKWKQINTEHFRLIFPSEYENEAFSTASIFEESYKLIAGRYGEAEIKKFPIIIHNHSIESNGYVAWAPKRVELYPFPGQNSIPLSHKKQLALHELIHVVQLQALRNGVARPMEFLLGEQISGALSIFTPFWFLEGEAVVSESIFSQSGRGRQPDFEKRLKALLLEKGGGYSYDKLLSGSYKDYTPDHYQFGYQMVAFARSNYGDEIFPNAVEKIAKRPYLLNPFNISLRKDAGIGKKGIYDATMGYLKSSWLNQDSLLQKSAFTYLEFNDMQEYVNYYSPIAAGRDSVLAIKTSLTNSPEVVLITKGGAYEEKLFSTGYLWPYRISYANNIITWAENKTDPRWNNRGFSIIKTYNILSGEMLSLSRNSRFFSPSISSDGRMIVTVESDPQFNNSLVILDRFTGSVLDRINPPDNELPVNPRWLPDNKRIAFITFSDKGEGITTYDIRSGAFQRLVNPGNADLQSLAIRNDTLFYVASYSGIDNIFAKGPSGKTEQLTSSRFGVSDISFYGESLLFTDYSSAGNRIGSFPVSEVYKEVDPLKSEPLLLIKKIDSSSKIPHLSDLELETYPVESYRKWQHLFDLHSWMPFYADINNISFDNIGISPGLTLMSQNHLSTLTSSIAYEYLSGEHLFHTNLLWEGQYPVIDFDLTYGGSPFIVRDQDSLYYPSIIKQGLRASASIYLPLRFNTGRYNQTLYPSLGLSYKNDYIFEEEGTTFDYGQVLATGRIYFSNLHRMAHRDIWPRWGQVFDISATLSPGDQDIYGRVSTIRTTLYAPGVFPNHGIRIKYQAEKQKGARFLQYNRVSFPRGYNHIISSDLVSYSADYAMPFLYPDLNIGSIIYLNRIRGGVFYDFSKGSDNYYVDEKKSVPEEVKFISYGAELIADFYLFRLPFRFSGGVQTAWLPIEKEPYLNLIFNIDVFGFAIGEKRY